MNAIQAICPEPGRIELMEVTLADPGPGELLVETEATVVSPGTERAWYLQEPNTLVRFPYRPGYSHVGRILAVGEGVTGFHVGDRVQSNGRHASAALVHAHQAVPVPAGVETYAAALGSLAHICLQGVRKAGIELGHAVALIGAGLIGQLTLKFALLSGAHPMVVCDLSEHRLRLAMSCGATQTVAPDELVTISQSVERSLTSDWGFDVVIDATGHPSAFNTAVAATGAGGAIILQGGTRGLVDGVNVYEIHRKGVRIIGAHERNCPADQTQPRMWTRKDNKALYLRLLRDGVLSVGELFSDVVSSADIPDVFRRLEARDESLIACVIDWRK